MLGGGSYRTRALVGAVMDNMFVVANQMLETSNSGMADLVVSGYGVDPQAFYAEVIRLVDLRLRSIGYIEG